jgi:hypothetical protein
MRRGEREGEGERGIDKNNTNRMEGGGGREIYIIQIG